MTVSSRDTVHLSGPAPKKRRQDHQKNGILHFPKKGCTILVVRKKERCLQERKPFSTERERLQSPEKKRVLSIDSHDRQAPASTVKKEKQTETRSGRGSHLHQTSPLCKNDTTVEKNTQKASLSEGSCPQGGRKEL